MHFTLPCSCGEQLSISAIDAGRARQCLCTREYQIPPLMELRRFEAAGVTEIAPLRTKDLPPSLKPLPRETRIYSEAQKLALLDRRGRLPLESQCLVCDAATKHVLSCFIECEVREERPKNSILVYWLMAVFSPIHGFFHYLIDRDEPEVVGEEVIVHAPLRLCPECATRCGRDAKALRERLLQMPLYQPLFRDYPDAVIRLSRS